MEGQREMLLIGGQLRFGHLTTNDLRCQVGVIHLGNIVPLCLEMDVEGRVCLDNLCQGLLCLVSIKARRKSDGRGQIIGCVQRMLHALVIDTQLGVVEGRGGQFLVHG